MSARLTQAPALLLVSRDPDPALVLNPEGGGVVAPGIDPDPGVDLCGAEVPIAFADITPHGGTTVRYSKVPINVTVPDDPRIKTFGTVTRALTNRSGDFRGSTASPTLIDTDRFLRGLEDTDSLVNAVLEYFISTEPAIKAGLTPRRVFSGLVTDSEPISSLLMRLQASDYLQSRLDVQPQPTYPQRVFNLDDFPNLANDPKNPSSPGNPTLIGKPVPIGYGFLSDEHKGDAARGVVPAYFVGRRYVDGFDWDEFVLFGHAPSVGGVLGFFGDIAGKRIRCQNDQEGGEFLWPGHTGWNAKVGPDTYRDYNGNRYTVVYGLGPRSESARDGRIPFTVNIGGIEDVGDGTGLTIDSLPRQICHLLINWILQSYTSGPWLAPPLVNSYSRVKTVSFETAKTTTEGRMAGGHLGAFALGVNGSTITLSDLAKLAYDHGLYLGDNKDGQIIGSAIDPLAAPVRAVSDVTDTIKQSFGARRQRAEVRNRQLYRFEKRYVPEIPETTPPSGENMPADLRVPEPEWESDNQGPLTNAASIDKYGARTMDLSLWLTRDQATADDIAALHAEVLPPGPMAAKYREGLCGTNVELGDNVELTHFEGPTASGYVDRKLRCELHTTDLDAMTVETQNLDVTLLAEAGEDAIEFEAFMSRLLMGTQELGGSRVDTCLTESAIVVPFNYQRGIINWALIPDTHEIVFDVEVGTGAGSITPNLYEFGDDTGDAAVVTGTLSTASAMTRQQHVVPRPGGDGVVEYWMLPLLASGAADTDAKMLGRLRVREIGSEV